MSPSVESSLNTPSQGCSALGSGSFLRQDVLVLLLLLGIGAAVFFGTMGCRDLWEPEELRYAEVTREMQRPVEWFVLHLNGVKYPDKPPLFFWSIALTARCIGELSEFAVRLPSVMSGLGVLLFTFLLGHRLYGGRTGLLAGMFLLTMPFFAQMAIEARMDMMLTMFITAALFCLYIAYEKGGSKWLYLIAYVFMGLGILTKGPIGALLPLLTFGVFVFLKDGLRTTVCWRKRMGVLVGRVRGALRFRYSPAPLWIGWGVLVMFLVVGPWLIPACILGGSAHAFDLLFHQNLDRYFNSWTHQNESFFLYMIYVPLQILPWALFLPCMLIYGAAREPAISRWERRFPLVWFITVFVFFTLCSSKRWIYTFPILPAAALMLAGVINECLLPDGRWQGALRTVTKYVYLATLFAMGIAGVGTPLVCAIWARNWALVALPGGLVLTAGAAASLYFFYRGRLNLSLIALFAAALVAWVATAWTFFPQRNKIVSAKVMLKKVTRFVPAGEPLYTYGTQRNGYAYYWRREPPMINLSTAGTEVEAEKRLRALFQGPRPIFCLMSQRTYNSLQRDPTLKMHVLLSDLMGSRNLVLVSNRPVK